VSPLKVYVAGEHGGPLDLRDELRQQEGVELVWDGSVAEVVLYALDDGPLRRDRVRGLVAASAAPVVLAARRADANLLDQALEDNVADVLLIPESPDRIVFALLKAARTAELRSTPAVTGHSANVVTVFSPKGGTGKTVVSTNVASYLAKQGLRTLLVDLDLQFGDAAIMLGLEPERTLYELASAPGELDDGKLRGYITSHGQTGLEVLAAPLRPEDGELVSEQKIEETIDLARSSYDVIVVDTWPSFHGPTLSALDRADTVLLVCNPELPTLKNVRLGIETLRRLSFPEQRLNVVLNRADDREIVRTKEAEEALGVRVAYELPRAYEVSMAVNRGEPLVLMSKAHPFAVAVRALGDSLAQGIEPAHAPQREPSPRFTDSMRGLAANLFADRVPAGSGA
jgi:pilus assembly protein CpaE